MPEPNQNRLHVVQQRIRQACAQHDRDPGQVQLLAVSKAQPAEKIRAVHQAGQCAFGENHLSEALDKMAELRDLGLEWHFIGPLQSNKTRAVAEHFAWVHSADRARILDRLDAQRPGNLPRLNICLQVNLDDEDSKSGCRPEQLPALAAHAAAHTRLRLRGLMAIPAPRPHFDQQRRAFERLHRLFDSLRQNHPEIDTLSAGMSADLEAAIAAGSTLVRVGSALFGARPRNRFSEVS